MNILTNPGFESGSTSWVFGTGSALVEDGSGIGGGNCARLSASRIRLNLPPAPPIYAEFEGQILQLPPFEVDTVYIISGYAKPELAWGSLEVSAGESVVAAWDESADSDWSVRYGMYYGTLPEAQFVVRAVKGAGTGSSSWLVDNLAVEIGGRNMARSIYNSYTALFNRLKEINGSTGGYHHNVSSQVIPKLVLPSEPGAPKMPYICLPLSDTGTYEVSERGIRAALRQQIVAFLPESESHDISDCSAVRALKFHDDIIKVMMPESPATAWNLGDQYVEDVALLSKEIVAGQNDGIPWSEVNVAVDVFTRFDRSDLGPA